MRRYIIAIVFLLTFLFFFFRFAEMQEIVAILQAGDWRFFSLAFILQILWLMTITYGLQGIYRNLNMRETPWRVFQLVTASNFISAIAPSSGASGLAVYLADARRREHPLGRVTIACMLLVFFDYLAVLLGAIYALFYMANLNRLNWIHITAVSVLFIILLTLVLLLVIGARSTSQLASVLAFLARQVNRLAHFLFKRKPLDEERARALAYETAEGVRDLSANPKSYLLPAGLIILNKPIMFMILGLVFLAFKIPFTVGLLITGLSLGYLFAIATPSPATPGVVDSLMVLALTTLGLRLEAATILTFGYRAVTYWLPLVIGLWNFRQVAGSQKIAA